MQLDAFLNIDNFKYLLHSNFRDTQLMQIDFEKLFSCSLLLFWIICHLLSTKHTFLYQKEIILRHSSFTHWPYHFLNILIFEFLNFLLTLLGSSHLHLLCTTTLARGGWLNSDLLFKSSSSGLVYILTASLACLVRASLNFCVISIWNLTSPFGCWLKICL